MQKWPRLTKLHMSPSPYRVDQPSKMRLNRELLAQICTQQCIKQSVSHREPDEGYGLQLD